MLINMLITLVYFFIGDVFLFAGIKYTRKEFKNMGYSRAETISGRTFGAGMIFFLAFLQYYAIFLIWR